jgi:N-acetylmuramoyl-L-alanine amidase/FG-GAP-like repeat
VRANVAANLPRQDGTLRRQPRRWAAAGLAVACLSTVLSTVFVLAPTPRIVSAAEAQVRTERVRLGPRGNERADDPIGVAAASSAEGRELRAALASPGRRTSPRRTSQINAIGITLPAPPEAPILVRGRVDGTWTPWFELPFASGESPDGPPEDGRAGVQSEPVWLGDADAYELDAPASVTTVDVHVVGDGPVERRVELSSSIAGAAGAPSIQPRSAWGARPPTQHPATTADLKLAVVHHTVSGNTYTPAQVPQMIRSVQAYHQDARGYTDLAYNIVVDRFGRAWEGRAGGLTNVVLGGHSQGFNTGSVGVVVLGDYRSANPSAATVETVAQVIAWKFALHRVDPRSTVPFTSAGSAKYPTGTRVTLPRIVGHRDVQATDCPGGNLYAKLGTIRTRVAQLVPSYQAGLTPLLLAPDLTGDTATDPIQYRPGPGGDALWRASGAGTVARHATSITGAYRPAVGDFDGNGHTDVLWHATGSAADFMWWAGPAGIAGQGLTVHGSYVPITGDFDGNGVDDVLWYATGPAPDAVWYFQRDRSYVSRVVAQDLITGVPLTGDFDGDGIDDVFFYGPGSADDRLWRGNGNRTFRVTAPAVNGWYDPVALDATGDGVDDVLWYAPEATTSYRWDFQPDGSFRTRALTTSALRGRPTVGDFDGDGLDDVLIVAAGSSRDAAWYSTPTGIDQRSMVVNGSYSIATGPMDPGELGSDDVLFVAASGAAYQWQGAPTRTFVSAAVR